MQHIRCQQGDSTVMVVMVIPGEEALAKGACVLDGTETVGEFGPVLEGFELALRVWVVVRACGRATLVRHLGDVRQGKPGARPTGIQKKGLKREELPRGLFRQCFSFSSSLNKTGCISESAAPSPFARSAVI